MRRYVSKDMHFFYHFFSLYHYKIHPVNNYKAIKNKMNKTRQDRTKKIFLTNETATTTTTTKIKIKKNGKETEVKLLAPAPPPAAFLF